MSKIELKHIDKFYGKNHVLKDLNLTIEDGDFMTLLGPSGCGKTTTLRVVSGLEKPQNGFIYMDGKEIVNAAEAYYAPPSQRNLNLVFQSYALWPHMTVFENVSFGLKIKKIPSAEIEKMVASALERMQIGQYAKRYPTELSGGQQQRVAIARAIARSPQHGVQAQIHVRDDVPHEDDRHVVAGITDRRLARPEKVEDRIEQQQRYETECQADDEVQHHDVAQDVLRRLVVSLPEAHGHQRRSTHTHQRTESRGEVHQREGQRKARNGQRPYPVADEDTVDHVVERRSRHGDDRRHGILHEQLANTLRPELRRRPFYRCRHIIYYQLCPGESRTNYLTIP